MEEEDTCLHFLLLSNQEKKHIIYNWYKALEVLLFVFFFFPVVFALNLKTVKLQSICRKLESCGTDLRKKYLQNVV